MLGICSTVSNRDGYPMGVLFFKGYGCGNVKNGRLQTSPVHGGGSCPSPRAERVGVGASLHALVLRIDAIPCQGAPNP
jgi:hypothetical protein